MSHKFTVDFLNKRKNGFRVKEFVPGKKLVLTRRFRFRIQGAGLRLFSVAIMAFAFAIIGGWLQHPSKENIRMLLLAAFLLFVVYFLLFVEVMSLVLGRMAIEVGKGAEVRDWGALKPVTDHFSEDHLSLQPGEVVAYARANRRKISKKSTNKTLYLDIYLKTGTKSRRMFAIEQKDSYNIEQDVEALNDLFNSFTDHYVEHIPSMEIPEDILP